MLAFSGSRGNSGQFERLQALLLAHMERTGDPQVEAYRKAVAAWAKSSGH